MQTSSRGPRTKWTSLVATARLFTHLSARYLTRPRRAGRLRGAWELRCRSRYTRSTVSSCRKGRRNEPATAAMPDYGSSISGPVWSCLWWAASRTSTDITDNRTFTRAFSIYTHIRAADSHGHGRCPNSYSDNPAAHANTSVGHGKRQIGGEGNTEPDS